MSDEAWNSNVPVKERAALLAANGNDRNKAYRAYMQGYVDRTIDVRRHMIDQGGVEVPATVTLMGEAIGNEKSKSK